MATAMRRTEVFDRLALGRLMSHKIKLSPPSTVTTASEMTLGVSIDLRIFHWLTAAQERQSNKKLDTFLQYQQLSPIRK
jgi:hypothetical protein